MIFDFNQQCHLDALINKRFHTGHIAELTGWPAEDIHEYREGRRKARHGACNDRNPPDLLQALEEAEFPSEWRKPLRRPENVSGMELLHEDQRGRKAFR